MEAYDLRACAGLAVEPEREPLVKAGSPAARDRRIGGVADQNVLEAEPVLTRRRAAVRANETSPDKGHQAGADGSQFVPGRERLDSSPPELSANNGGTLEHVVVLAWEGVKPTREERLKGWRHLPGLEGLIGCEAVISILGALPAASVSTTVERSIVIRPSAGV